MKIAIVDDEEKARRQLAETLELGGFETFIIENSFYEVDTLVQHIQQNAQAVICDYQLSKHGLASFEGSELMPSLYTSKFPAILITQYIANFSLVRYSSKNE